MRRKEGGGEEERKRRRRRAASLGSDVWVEEEELWCWSAAQIRFSHKSLKLLRERRPTACLSVCLSGLREEKSEEEKNS